MRSAAALPCCQLRPLPIHEHSSGGSVAASTASLKGTKPRNQQGLGKGEQRVCSFGLDVWCLWAGTDLSLPGAAAQSQNLWLSRPRRGQLAEEV